MMRQLWQKIAQPSLVRRLLVAQMVLLTALWSSLTLIALLEPSAGGSGPLLRKHLVFPPGATQAEADPAAAPPMQVFTILRQQGQELYRSPGTPPQVQPPPAGTVVHVKVDGRLWLARTEMAPDGNTSVTTIKRAEGWGFFVDSSSRSLYVLPLLVSLPLLLIPAWLSIRIALRPWHALADAVAHKGPDNLEPLAPPVDYAETAPVVDSINSLIGRVRESVERERRFIGDAAHELRTPLAAMQVNVEALEQRRSDATEQALLKGIKNSMQRASRLVTQLLLLMRSSSAGPVTMDTIDLDLLLQERLAALSTLARQCGVELELQATSRLALMGNRESLVSLFDNVIENAIGYSPAGTVVRVAAIEQDAGIVVGVSDSGPGIPAALRQRVFDRFYRAPDQARAGTGLGLSIASAAAQAHGGTIVLGETATGTGLLVKITLPG